MAHAQVLEVPVEASAAEALLRFMYTGGLEPAVAGRAAAPRGPLPGGDSHSCMTGRGHEWAAALGWSTRRLSVGEHGAVSRVRWVNKGGSSHKHPRWRAGSFKKGGVHGMNLPLAEHAALASGKAWALASTRSNFPVVWHAPSSGPHL
jgi:hypothetical protein